MIGAPWLCAAPTRPRSLGCEGSAFLGIPVLGCRPFASGHEFEEGAGRTIPEDIDLVWRNVGRPEAFDALPHEAVHGLQVVLGPCPVTAEVLFYPFA